MTMAVSKVKDEIMEKVRREDGEKQYGTRLVTGFDPIFYGTVSFQKQIVSNIFVPLSTSYLSYQSSVH